MVWGVEPEATDQTAGALGCIGAHGAEFGGEREEIRFREWGWPGKGYWEEGCDG